MDRSNWYLRKSDGISINRLFSLVFFRINSLHLYICLPDRQVAKNK